MKSWFSPLLFMLASSSEDDLRRQIEFLKAEVEMLRKRVPKKRIFLDNEEKERLLNLGEAIGPKISQLITIVHPRTYQRWLERKSRGEKPMKKMGRTETPLPVKEIILKIAKETGWGYDRIVGELRKLRILGVGRTTVGTLAPQVHKRGRKAAVSDKKKTELCKRLEEHPDATVLEHRDALGIECSEKTMWQTMRKLGWRFKKSRRVPQNKIEQTLS